MYLTMAFFIVNVTGLFHELNRGIFIIQVELIPNRARTLANRPDRANSGQIVWKTIFLVEFSRVAIFRVGNEISRFALPGAT